MFCKLFMLAVCLAVVVAQADRYPAGVSAALCPGYPICDNNLLALHSARAAPVATSSARQYPSGVNAALCPNYPYCDHGGIPVTANFYPGARQYPAGVNPAACPNYPYC